LVLVNFELEIAVVGIWENGFVLWDISGSIIRRSIDGWMGENDEIQKPQENCKGMLRYIHQCFVFSSN